MGNKGDAKIAAQLLNLEAEFAEALGEARREEVSAYLAEKRGKRRGAALPLDVKLFTLESKIARLRAKLGLPPFEPLPRKPDEQPAGRGARWPRAVAPECSVYPLDPARLWEELEASGRDPAALFAKLKLAGPKARQSPSQPVWRLLAVECGDERPPARLTLTLLPLPEGPDAEAAAEKLQAALDKIVSWAERAQETPARGRPRSLHALFTRATRGLQLAVR